MYIYVMPLHCVILLRTSNCLHAYKLFGSIIELAWVIKINALLKTIIYQMSCMTGSFHSMGLRYEYQERPGVQLKNSIRVFMALRVNTRGSLMVGTTRGGRVTRVQRLKLHGLYIYMQGQIISIYE